MFGLMPRGRERTAVARTPFELFRNELASLFETPLWAFGNIWEPEPWRFATEEHENEVVLRAELPGFEASELEVTVGENTLTLRGEHTEAGEGEAKERRHARLERTMTLPEGVETAKAEARYRNGVLEVHLPRAPEARPRRIEVKT